MHFIKFTLAALSLSLVAAASNASITSPASGVDFRTLDKAQPVESTNKVEVTEFFMYSCPHCNAFDPMLAEWVKAQGDNIVFKRVPLAFQEGQELHQKLYYALEVLGKNEELHKKIFHAIHIERKQLNDEASIADFVASQGVDRAKFVSAFESFGVQAKIKRASQLAEIYKVDGVPLLAVDGRFETSPAVVSGSVATHTEQELFADTLKVMDWLVVKAAKEHKPAAASAAPAAAKSGAVAKK